MEDLECDREAIPVVEPPVSPSKRILIRQGASSLLDRYKNAGASPAVIDSVHDVTLIPPYQLFTALESMKTRRHVRKGCLQFFTILCLGLFVMTYRIPTSASQTASALAGIFIDEAFTVVGNDTEFKKFNFKEIQTIEDFWLWMKGPLSSNIFEGCDAGDSVSLNSGTSQLYVLGGSVGGVQMRTNRAINQSCVGANWTDCYSYIEQGESTDYYGPTSSDDVSLVRAFTFDESFPVFEGSVAGNPVFGSAMYGPGAFGFEFPVKSCSGNAALLDSLIEYNWLDVTSRLVSVEFNVYNPAIGLLTSCTFYVEFSPTGFVRPKYSFYHAVVFDGSTRVAPLVFGTLFFLGLLIQAYWFLVKAYNMNVRKMLRAKFVFSLGLFGLLWTSTVMVFISLDFVASDFEPLVSGSTYVSTYTETRFLHNMDAIISVNLVIGTIRFINFLPFKITRLLMAAMRHSLVEVGVLALVILVFWAAFTIGAHISFGPLGLDGFIMLDYTFGSLMILMFSGDTDYFTMQSVSSHSAPLFYLVYMIFMWGIMLNLFVAIIIYSFEGVKRMRNEYKSWLEAHAKAVGNTQMVLKTAEHMTYLYYSAQLRLLQCFSSTGPSASSSSKFRPSIFLRKSNKRDEEMRGIQMGLVIDKSAVEESKRLVMRITDLDLRYNTAKRVGFPYRRAFRLLVRKHLHRTRVEKFRLYILNLVNDDNPTNFTKLWRKEFEKSYTSAESSLSLKQWWMKFKDSWFQCGGKRTEMVDSDSSQSLNNLSMALSAKVSRGSRRKRDFQQRIQYKIARVERELEVMRLKLELERILRETENLFNNHKLKFRSIVQGTWRRGSEKDRLRKLSKMELREVMSTICVDVNKSCPYCQDGTIIDDRVEKFIETYQTLVLKQSALDKTRDTQRRLYRLSDLFKKEEEEFKK